MTKEKLKRYRKLCMDIAALEEEIAEMEAGNGSGADVVKDYRSGQPVPRVITGFEWKRYEEKSALLARKIKERDIIRQWIEDIEDGQIRTVFRLRYMDGCSWLKIARKIGVPHKEDYVRIVLHDRFIKKS